MPNLLAILLQKFLHINNLIASRKMCDFPLQTVKYKRLNNE